MKAASRNILISSEWVLTFVVLQSSILFCKSNDYNHNLSGLSQVPWNVLLNPNYTNHKVVQKTNRTSFSTANSAEYPTALSHQQNSFNSVKELTSSRESYVQPATSNPHLTHPLKHSSPFIHHDGIKGESFSFPHRSPTKVIFPKASSFQVSKSVMTDQPPWTFRPSTVDLHYDVHQAEKQKSQLISQDENSSNKQRNRKITHDFDFNEEEDYYLDSYYHDYDSVESKKDISKTSHPLSLTNNSQKLRDPLKYLHASLDSDRFLTKEKDLSVGGSDNRPSYSVGASADSPNRYYGDIEPYRGLSYTDQDDNDYSTADVPYGLPGYNYAPENSDGKYSGIAPYPDRRKMSKYGPFAFALGLLPLGLLIASLVPTVVAIPVTTAVATGRRRKRNAKFINPALETISKYGVGALEDPSCLNRIFCQVVRDGHLKRSSIIQKLFLKTAYVMDEKIAAYVGLKSLHLAISKNKCHHFHCSMKENVYT